MIAVHPFPDDGHIAPADVTTSHRTAYRFDPRMPRFSRLGAH